MAYTLLAACAPTSVQPVAAPTQDVTPAPTFAAGLHSVEIALDLGRIVEGAWVSEAGRDLLIEPVAAQVGDRAVAMIADGAQVAVVERACGRVHVPFFVDADSTIVSLPYPACGERGPEGLWSAEDLDVLRGLELLPEVPPSDGAFAAFVTFAEAKAACAWYGRALLEAADVGPVAVWLRSGDGSESTARVVGGDWATVTEVPASARDHSSGCGVLPKRTFAGLKVQQPPLEPSLHV